MLLSRYKHSAGPGDLFFIFHDKRRTIVYKSHTQRQCEILSLSSVLVNASIITSKRSGMDLRILRDVSRIVKLRARIGITRI